MKFIVIFFLAFLNFNSLIAQQQGTLRGKVTDSTGEAVPFTAVYARGTTNGTTANSEGFYTLSLPYGRHEIVVQFVGYKTTSTVINLQSENLELNFILSEESLKAVEITNKETEDYAYEIIRNAQKNRKKYLNEFSDYTCKVYLKGVAKIDKKPDSFFGEKTTDVDTGIVYLSESVSELSYQNSPKQYKERMVASKVSGDSKGFSFNFAAGWRFNFYENLTGQGLTERGLISPIAGNALLYYDYEWQGEKQEDSLRIHKIKLLPKRKTDPVWDGYLYIVHGSWRIHSVDFSFDKNRPVDFVNSGTIQQVFAPTGSNTWALISQQFNFGFGLFGFKGSGYFTKNFSDYNLQPKFEKRYFNGEIMFVEPSSNKKDSTFWKRTRPIPLTIEEKEDYRKKDSTEVIKNSRPYLDSVDKVYNRFKFPGGLLSGYRWRNSFKKYSLEFKSPINSISFNTVEGLVLNLEVDYNKELEGNRQFNISPQFRYGFSSQQFYSLLKASYLSSAVTKQRFSIEGGSFVEQFYPGSILSYVNTISTLYNEFNYMKLYRKDYGIIGYERELTNEVFLSTNLEYAERSPLENTTNYVWRNFSERDYSLNIPLNDEAPTTVFSQHQALTWNVSVRFTFKQLYITRPDMKINIGSKYPTLTLNYQKGVAWLNSDVNFDRIQATIQHDFRLGLLGQSNYELFGGLFLNNKQLFFMDYKHFNGNRTTLSFPTFRFFQLLDYYRASTADRYAGGHFEHHFNGFFFNRIPFIKKLRIQETFNVNYLYTPTLENYLELGVGIEHIFKVIRLDYYWNFTSTQPQISGLRFGIGF